MTKPLIHGSRGVVPASKLVEVIGATIDNIRKEDKLTWADVGAAIGRSDDQAAKYAEGTATMDAPTFLRACNSWNGRFANPVFALFNLHIEEQSARNVGDVPHLLLGMTHLSASLQQAMLDQQLDDDEVIAMQPYIEVVGGLVDYLRKRLADALARRAAAKHA